FAGCFNCNGRAGGCSEHHQPHDRCAANDLAATHDAHVGIELFDRSHELRRRARMQTLPVANAQAAHHGAVAEALLIWRTLLSARGWSAHLPVSTRLAMVTYFRPASWAAATASASGHSSRTLASLTSIGRLMPARTSTFGRLITEMARFEGVPPNISVKIATPSPVSTRLTAPIMPLRRSST